MPELRERFRALDALDPPDVLSRARAIGPRPPDPEPPPRTQRIAVYAMAAVLTALALFAIARVVDRPTTPAIEPTPTQTDLGIFAPVAGRIVYQNAGFDLGLDSGLWGVDPETAQDPRVGPIVDREIASELAQLSEVEGVPLAWSGDGTELLVERDVSPGDPRSPELLYLVHADGTETQLTPQPVAMIEGATISPDGSRVVFAGWSPREPGGRCCPRSALYAVDAAGGTPEILVEPGNILVYAPAFSPDGTRIAYVDGGGDHTHQVMVIDADGSNPHQIVSNEATRVGHVFGLAWSPSGGRIALGLLRYVSSDGPSAIYTFEPDGTGFALAITDAISPFWSPDGSRIAYTTPCDDLPSGCPVIGPSGGSPGHLGIALADGSEARSLGFAVAGPWHPGSGDPTEANP